MSITLLPSATGGSNHSSYETVMKEFDRIFADPRVTASQIGRYGVEWSMRSGMLDVPHTLWKDVGVYCLRGIGSELTAGANTRLDLIKPGSHGGLFASYVFSLGGVYNLADSHGRDQLATIQAPARQSQHYANVENLLSRVPEFNPDQAEASVSFFPIPQQLQNGEAAA